MKILVDEEGKQFVNKLIDLGIRGGAFSDFETIQNVKASIKDIIEEPVNAKSEALKAVEENDE